MINNKEISTIDVLIGIAYYLPRGQRNYSHDSEKFHLFFYNQRERFPGLLGKLRFDSDGRYPESPDLRESIETLFSSGILSTNSANQSRYLFDDDACVFYFAKNLTGLPEKTKNEIQNLSARFNRNIR